MKSQRIALLSFAVLAASCASGTTTTPSRSSSPESPVFSPTPSPTVAPIQIPPIPEGTYEADITRKDFDRVKDCGDPSGVDENTGHIAITFRNGRFRWVLSADHPIFHPLFTGTYTGTGRRVAMAFDANTANEGVDTLRWTFDGKYLRFKVLSALGDQSPPESHLCGARVQYESHPWLKTG